MANILDCLVGRDAISAENVHDYVQLSFENDIRLSIYNDIALDPGTVEIADFAGRELISVKQGDDSISLQFSGHACISIDMRHEAYRGPEALELHRRSEPPVIWN